MRTGADGNSRDSYGKREGLPSTMMAPDVIVTSLENLAPMFAYMEQFSMTMMASMIPLRTKADSY